MPRLISIALLVGLLPACTHLPDFPGLLKPAKSTTLHAEAGQYSFAWRLSGDRQVAPLQVFDNGEKTWLQFPKEHTVPAIFQRSSTGDRLLTYRRQGPYVILSGVWPSLILRGGSLQSRIDRIVDVDTQTHTHADANDDVDAVAHKAHSPGLNAKASAVVTEVVPTIETLPIQEEKPVESVTALAEASFEAATVEVKPVVTQSLPELGFSDPVTSLALAEPPSTHSVSPQDKNLRSALVRWAAAAGWTFEPEHWAVDADIPIVGSAIFDSHFKLAVQELVASTELADRPLQPCFYSNQVLRIVPYAQTCDRSAGVATS